MHLPLSPIYGEYESAIASSYGFSSLAQAVEAHNFSYRDPQLTTKTTAVIRMLKVRSRIAAQY